MKRAIKIASALCEAAIVAALAWKHAALFNFTVPGVLLLVSPVLLLLHFAALNKERLPREERLTLILLTGPGVLLGLSLVLALNYELKAARMAGGATKEMGHAADKEGVPAACTEQWAKDTVRRMESERALLGLLAMSMCLLYASRLRGRFGEQTVEAADKPAPSGPNAKSVSTLVRSLVHQDPI